MQNTPRQPHNPFNEIMTSSEYDRAGKIFDDSIHGRITLHPLLEQIVDTPQIQRLRHIKQLGGIYYDYIGAERSRFQHSIGMCHLSGIFLDTLQKRQADLSISKRDVLCVQIAALCRNLGQGPFSYLFEELVLPKIRTSGKHWKFRDGSISMLHHLLHVNNLRPKFEEFGLVWEEDVPFIEELITGNPNKGRNPEKRFLYEIVTNKQNGIDVNKMDYIARDSQELCYSHNFDWKQYMNSVRVITADDGFTHICCREDEVNLVHDFYRIRFNLFYDYYQHWKARAIENMIAEALVKANDYITISGEHGTPRKLSEVVDDMYAFTKLTDSITEMIRMDLREEEMKESKKLLNDIQRNQIHQYIGCLKYLPINVGTALAKTLSQQLADIYDDIETESNIKLQANFILLDVVHLDLGRGEHDPMRDTWFYNPDNPNVATRAKEGLPTTEYTVPNIYQWMEIRVYSRWNNTPEITEAIKRAFERFLKAEGHNGTVHDSSTEKGTVTQQPLTSAEIKKVTDATPTKQDKGDGMSYRPTTFRLMLETKNREVDELKAKHLELKTQLIQLQRKVDENEENERKIESLKKMSKSKDKEVENTKKILEEKKREIVELQSQNEVLQSNLNEKNQEIEQKSLECEELSHEVRQLQSVEKTLAEESLNTKAQQMSSKQAEESNKFRFFSTLFFVVLVCYSYITQDQFPSPLPGVNVIATTQIIVIGGQVNELHWMEYGLNIYIPPRVLPKGFLATLVVRVSLSGPFSNPNSNFWKTSSAVYWISSSKDFEESVIISIWHTVRNFQNNSQLRFVSSEDELVNGKYLFKVLDGGSFDNSYGHIAVSHFTAFKVQSTNQTEESFVGSLFYRRCSPRIRQWDYSFLIYHDMPIGMMETVLTKSGEYTGWHKHPQITVQFEKDDITLELNESASINGWTLRLKYFPAKYEKNDLSNHFGRIISNMQFTVKQTRKDLSSYLNTRIPLIGSKRPKIIPVDIDTEMDIGETAYNPGTLTEITSVDELQPWLEYVTSPLIYSSCLKMGKEEADRAKKEQIFVEERVYQITKKWFDQNTSCTWKDFAKSFACMKNCKIAKKISKEKFVYFFKQVDSDTLEKCPDLPVI